MNKLKAKLFVVFTILVTLFNTFSLTNVNAATADGMPSTITITSNKEIAYIYGGMKNGHIAALVKKAGNGYVYCIEPQKSTLGKETLSYVGELTDPGYLYLASHGFPNKTVISEYGDDENYYVTQIAHWIYAYVVYGWKDGDKIVGHIIDSNGNKHLSFNGSSNESYKQTKLANAAYELYLGAKKAHDAGKTNTTLKVSAKVSDKTLVKNGNNLLSNKVSVTVSGASKYTVSVNKGTVVDENGNAKTTFDADEKFRVKTSYADAASITATIKVENTTQKVYRYAPSSDTKQDVLYSVVNSVKNNASTTVKFEYAVDETLISKVDATTGNELAGAHLEIYDSKNVLVESWVSTEEVHKVKLAPGTYKLVESIQPEGYILSKEEVTFTVNADGSSSKVVMKNQPIKETLISKVDATTGNELAGAHLEIYDSNNVLVESWVSTEEVHKVKLAPGTYKLVESIQPEGYILSKEEVTFTVNADGSSSKVVMKNEPIRNPIEISKVDASTGNELAGAHLELYDSNNELVEEWISTDEVHKIVLDDGIYTLSETIAPEGYELTTETISFEVVDGKVDTPIVMVNHPYHEVPPTALNANASMIGLGSILMLLGSGVLVLKLKKENE